ncbi:MAG TPA: hypothetical protein VJU61_23930 [Polyangiaceae bacterium]|nr:hypothetical protein [Polyangiaceae bacterium]
MRRGWPGIFAGVVWLLGGCAQEEHAQLLRDGFATPVEGCEDFSYRTCDVLEQACQRELFELVACLRGGEARPSELPPVRLMNESEALAAVLDTEPVAPSVEGEFETMAHALELLGLLEPGLLSAESDVLDVTLQSVVALYMPATTEVIIIDRGRALTGLDANTVLAHEFVHALQDAQHDLSRFDSEPSEDSDRALARAAVIEGEATLYELQLSFAYSGATLDRGDYARLFSELRGQGERLALDDGSPMMTSRLNFPYTYGARYMGQHWLEGGPSALDQLFEQVPQSSLEVMWQQGATELPTLQRFLTPPASLPGYHFVAEDVAGAWVLFSKLLELAGDLAAAPALRELALSWRGDRFWVYQSDDAEEVAVLWRIDWQDAEAALQFSELYGAASAHPAGLSMVVEGASTRVVIAEREPDLAAWADLASDSIP